MKSVFAAPGDYIYFKSQVPLHKIPSALVEFDFQVSGFFLDLQDGVRLCRVIQLLQHEPSILMAIGENYGLRIESFSSLVNGKAIWCVLDYYFRKELSCSNKNSHETRGDESIMSASYYTDVVVNFVLSQKLTALLGNFPEVLQISDLLEHKCGSVEFP